MRDWGSEDDGSLWDSFLCVLETHNKWLQSKILICSYVKGPIQFNMPASFLGFLGDVFTCMSHQLLFFSFQENLMPLCHISINWFGRWEQQEWYHSQVLVFKWVYMTVCVGAHTSTGGGCWSSLWFVSLQRTHLFSTHNACLTWRWHATLPLRSLW